MPSSARPPLPPLADLLERTHVLALPMRVEFRGITTRELAIVEGPAGWGEFGPFPEYDDAEAAAWLASAVEMAWQGPPEPLRDEVAVNATVPGVEPGRVDEILAGFPGCDTVKIKVATESMTADLARVRAVLAARPGARIRVDANGGWSVDEALTAIAEVERLCAESGGTFDYAEQPCRTVRELAEVRAGLAAAGSRAAVAADESIRRADDPFRVVRAGGADRAVLKAAPLGGPRRLVRLAAELGVPVTVSSALDSAVGMSAGLAAAAALPEPVAPAGLGTGGFFAEDVVDPGHRPQIASGRLPAARVAPDAGRVVTLSAPGDRREWWLRRVERVHALLAASRGAADL